MKKEVNALLNFIESETSIVVNRKRVAPPEKLINENSEPIRLDVVEICGGLCGLGVYTRVYRCDKPIIALDVLYMDEELHNLSEEVQVILAKATLLPVYISKLNEN